jgi:hypothetical protein
MPAIGQDPGVYIVRRVLAVPGGAIAEHRLQDVCCRVKWSTSFKIVSRVMVVEGDTVRLARPARNRGSRRPQEMLARNKA